MTTAFGFFMPEIDGEEIAVERATPEREASASAFSGEKSCVWHALLSNSSDLELLAPHIEGAQRRQVAPRRAFRALFAPLPFASLLAPAQRRVFAGLAGRGFGHRRFRFHPNRQCVRSERFFGVD